jgi:hypothetical protein
MFREKRLTFLIAFFLTQNSIACDNPNPNCNTTKRITPSIAEQLSRAFAHSYSLAPGLKLPIYLLIGDDGARPGCEPGIDYTVYNVEKGNEWPDWYWSEEEEQQKLTAPPAAPAPPFFARLYASLGLNGNNPVKH